MVKGLVSQHNPLRRAVVRRIDAYAPGLGTTYRRWRDRRYYARSQPIPTPFGFELTDGYNRATMQPGKGEIGVFQQYAAATDLIVDIGANIGLYTCIASQFGKPVIAVEPHPDNVRLLLTNLLHNGFKVEVHPVAVGSEVGILPLFGSRMAASLLRAWGGPGSASAHGAVEKILVPVTTLDNVIGERFEGRSLLVKIDVEGNEYEVLKGAPEVLSRTPAPTWILEHGLTENFGEGLINPHFEAVFDLFWSHGYRAFTVDDSQRLVTQEDVLRWVANRKRDFGEMNYLFRKDA